MESDASGRKCFQSSAEIYVQDLQPAAYAENGDPQGDGTVDRGKFRGVAQKIRRSRGFRIPRIKWRENVSAADQTQGGKTGKIARVKCVFRLFAKERKGV